MTKTKKIGTRIDTIVFNTFVVLGIILATFVIFTEKQLGEKPKNWRDLLL